MREKAMEYAKEKYTGKILDKALERLEYEFEKIESNNIESDLLALSEIIRKWSDKGYFVNVLRPLNNSVVIYLLGMLDIDPMNLNNFVDLDFASKE